ncbi:hypothetical protein NliqN6_4358 [Naganishia liquefaciens]|uniref:WSC domain-containing protein n=1 Tax=Naganishia liquefaciens TaxID=104408 RepID=A0A8H3YHU5_9TREE|nr:hypothetical protein NliqN6_4358 [Naganishia liquefaciens]
MTVNLCITTCQSKGFVLAGLQYGRQCYCGNAMAEGSGASTTGCTMPCAGASDEQCGNGYRSSLYTYVPSVAKSLGCYVDSGSPRLLPSYSFSSSSMTPTLCQSTCLSKGYTISGTSYGTQCYCSSTAPPATAKTADSDCSMKCAGSTATCGNAWRLNVYSISDTPVVTSPATTSAIRTSTTSTPTTTTSKPVATSSIPANPTSPVSLGCYLDNSSDRTMSYSAGGSSSMTPALCQSLCQDAGYIFAGASYGRECWCSNSAPAASAKTADTECSMACTGDAKSICGASWRLSIWRVPALTPTTSRVTSPITSAIRTSTTAIPTTTSRPVATSSIPANPTSPVSLGCYLDNSSDRTMSYSAGGSGSMTPALCQSLCQDAGYLFAGASYGRECWCSNSAPAASAKTADSECSMACTGDAKSICGASWRLSIWRVPALTPTTSSVTRITTTTARVTSTTSKVTSTTSATPKPTPTVGSTCVARDGGEKKVWAHHIVGNTYPYTKDDWRRDIQLAQASGIDGFALNFGLDYWQPARIADAYAVAAELGSTFKLFLSPDMDVIECVSTNNLALIQNYIATYQNHTAAAKYGGKSILTTFAGQNCRFGQSDMNKGWQLAMNGYRNSTYFAPAWTEGPEKFSTYDFDAFVNWGAAWPSSTSDIDMADDKYTMSKLGTRKLIATVSPIFFTHFSWKNWLYRSDDFMMSQKLEQLLCMRNQIDQIEIISWNDYGEAHYIGDIGGDQPPESRLYTTGIPHTDILPLIKYYATAWKNGAYPKITQDQVFIMARPHPANAVASGDSIGAPTGRDRSQDNFYAQVHLTAPAVVYLKTNNQSTTFNGVAGVNRFEAPLEIDSGVEVLVGRNGATVMSVTIPDYTFTANPVRYNFNYYIASST